jgi:hypothetical protein
MLLVAAVSSLAAGAGDRTDIIIIIIIIPFTPIANYCIVSIIRCLADHRHATIALLTN